MFNIRKTVFTKEIITADEMGQVCDQITRVAAMAVVRNPFAGVHQEDLSPLPYRIELHLLPPTLAGSRF